MFEEIMLFIAAVALCELFYLAPRMERYGVDALDFFNPISNYQTWTTLLRD